MQGLRIYGLHNQTHLFFTIYGVGVISEFYVATDESMEKIHEPNRALYVENLCMPRQANRLFGWAVASPPDRKTLPHQFAFSLNVTKVLTSPTE